jgi:uncharacterized protein (TIGR00369 family)
MARETMEPDLIRDNLCFVCGKDNAQGLRLSFSYPQPGRAETLCTIPARFSGWENLTHGGLLATLLDETMAHACLSGEGNAVTAELTVRFLKPVEVGRTVKVSGEVTQARGRVVHTSGEIRTADGEEVARGEARFILVKESISGRV